MGGVSEPVLWNKESIGEEPVARTNARAVSGGCHVREVISCPDQHMYTVICLAS